METTYRGIKIITSKNRKSKGYTSFLFIKGGWKSFDKCVCDFKYRAIEYAKIMIDGKIEDGYL